MWGQNNLGGDVGCLGILQRRDHANWTPGRQLPEMASFWPPSSPEVAGLAPTSREV